MNILVIGCGKVGASLANNLSAMGYDVSVVTSKQSDFSNLADDFSGYTTLGVEIDQDVLKKAGIENCEALAAVTSDDNVNLMVVQLAKKFFGVSKTVARVSDPKKNEVYNEFGIETVCSTNLTAGSLSAALSNNPSSCVTVGTHSIVMTEMEIPKEFEGKRLRDLEFADGEVLVAVEHKNKALSKSIPESYEFVSGDKLIIASISD